MIRHVLAKSASAPVTLAKQTRHVCPTFQLLAEIKLHRNIVQRWIALRVALTTPHANGAIVEATERALRATNNVHHFTQAATTQSNVAASRPRRRLPVIRPMCSARHLTAMIAANSIRANFALQTVIGVAWESMEHARQASMNHPANKGLANPSASTIAPAMALANGSWQNQSLADLSARAIRWTGGRATQWPAADRGPIAQRAHKRCSTRQRRASRRAQCEEQKYQLAPMPKSPSTA